MRPESEHVADWRNAAVYAPLLEADRSIFAWEWLRRDARYREAAERALRNTVAGAPHPKAAAWGLHAFEPPHLGAPHARPVWRSELHPPVLSVLAAEAGEAADRFELPRLERMSTMVRGREGCEHLLLSDGLRSIRLDVAVGSLSRGPVQLRYMLAGLASVERPLLTLRRLLALWRTGRFARSLHRPEPRARRWVLMLRAWDGLEAGVGQREIAEALLSPGAGGPRWRSQVPSVRLQVQRLVRSARRMAAGGYVDLLR